MLCISNIPQPMYNVQHNICTLNQQLSQTFRESVVNKRNY